jgi:hypothetical protein
VEAEGRDGGAHVMAPVNTQRHRTKDVRDRIWRYSTEAVVLAKVYWHYMIVGWQIVVDCRHFRTSLPAKTIEAYWGKWQGVAPEALAARTNLREELDH